MGTTIDVRTLGGSLEGRAELRMADLESKWSRFLPSSEVSRLNRSRGEPQPVSPDTVELIRCTVAGWQATGGAFDPTVHDAVRRLGYDRTFEAIQPLERLAEPLPSPGCGEIEVGERFVRLPLGVRIDPGGIGKGLAADLCARELVAAGARGALVSVGGDVATSGEAPSGGWIVDVHEPQFGAARCRVRIAQGGLATSTTLRRRWTAAGQAVHHLIDPASGEPARSPWAVATAIAGAAWWAEAATKPLLISGLGGLPEEVAGRVVSMDGTTAVCSRFGAFHD